MDVRDDVLLDIAFREDSITQQAVFAEPNLLLRKL